jgi:hypothetical protein
MTQGFVQVAVDGSGKQLGNEVYTVPIGTQLTDGSGNVTVTSAPLYFFREHIINADPTNPAGVASVTQGPQPGDFGLTARLPVGQPDMQAMMALLLDISQSLNTIANSGGLLGSSQTPALQAMREGLRSPGLISTTTPYPVIADRYGRLVPAPSYGRNFTDANSVTITTTTETVLQPADAGNFNDLLALVMCNTSATATRVDIRDQLSTVASPASTLGVMPFLLPAGDTRGISFHTPNYQSNINQTWTATLSGAVTDVRIWAYFAQTPRTY